jgi:hypothetical protein
VIFHLRDDRQQTWLFDGAAWRLLCLGDGPWASASLAFDRARGEVVALNPTSHFLGLAADPAVRVHPSPFNLVLTAGDPLALDAEGCGSAPLAYQWRRSGIPLRDDGRITGATTPTLRIDPTIVEDDGVYDVEVSNSLGTDSSKSVLVYVRPVPPCYADCDTSTGFEVLDIFDFLCFQNSFAAGAPYACDCDTPGGGPNQCDIFDFLCFQDRFARGCP